MSAKAENELREAIHDQQLRARRALTFQHINIVCSFPPPTLRNRLLMDVAPRALYCAMPELGRPAFVGRAEAAR